MPTVWRFSAVLFLSYNGIKTGVKLFGDRSVWTAMRKYIANSPRLPTMSSSSNVATQPHTFEPPSHRAFQPRRPYMWIDRSSQSVLWFRFLIVIVDYFFRFIHAILLVGISSE